MYFHERKNDTNIDKNFKENKFSVSSFLSLIEKYKKIIIISIVILVLLIIIILFFSNRKIINYLELNGEEIVTIYQGSDYIEPGYMAYNSKNEDLKSEVVIETTLNNKVIGEYEVMYTLGDITKVRTVNVIVKPKEYTYIHLNALEKGTTTVYVKLGDEYVEPGYMVFSSIGTDLTSKVMVSGKVDTNKKGTYKLVYSLLDSSGVTISTSRNVIVLDTDINLSLSTSSYTNNDITIDIEVVDEYFDYMILPDNEKITENKYTYKVTENGEYTFKAYNKKGMEKSKIIEVMNIDKTAPSGSCSATYKEGVTTINVTAKDNIGISKYVINNTNYTSNKITINGELKTVTITIYDKANNTKNISCNLKDEKPKIYYEREFSVKYYDSKSGGGLSYWLYIPEGATDNMPLIVYLHGTDSKGNDYEDNTKLAIQYGIGNDIYIKKREFNAIILMPQTRANKYLNMDELMELIDYVANMYKVNKKKISISAFSEGANELSNKIGNNVNYFTSVVLIANYINNPDNFVSIPVITMCGENDSDRNKSMKHFTNEVNRLGGNAIHYTLDDMEHNIVSGYYSVFRDDKYDLVNWMISHTKK